MRLFNDRIRYGVVAIVLHWLTAAAVIGLYAAGQIMTDMKPSLAQFELYQWHKSLGITVLVLTVLRLVWRLVNPVPALPPGMPAWQRRAARASHWAFYALLLATPLAGWAMVSASSLNIPTLLYGLVELPHIPQIAGAADKQALEALFKTAHALLANAMAALFLVHAGAAVYHHFRLRDAVLLRMLPVSGRALAERLAREGR